MSASTEVQRTLVKSPPELWAELSDPAALARHLSELGEIRITRTQPERAVDWEATAPDGATASGRVEISPSGWGTRVTFSAVRAAGAPAAPAPAAGDAATPAPEPLAETDPLRERDLPGEDDPIDDPLDADDPLDDPYADGDDPYADRDDPYADGQDPYLDDGPYVDDDDPYADDEIDGEDGDAVVLRADPAIAQPKHVPAPGPAPQAEPPRGFFARLLGFVRHATPEPRLQRATAEPAGYEPYADIADQLPPPELPSSMAMAEQVTLSYEDVGARPPASDLRAEPLPSELAALDPATLARAHAAEQTPAAAGGHEVAGPAPAQAGEPREIADELRTAEEVAAEEVAAEQVRAVLTSALDRLGAAHHRPFSRA